MRSEIDLIAARGDTIAFVEVKTRSPRTLFAGRSLSFEQQERIRGASRHFLREHGAAGFFRREYLFALVLTEDGRSYDFHLLRFRPRPRRTWP